MSTDTQERITPRDLGKIPRKTATIVCELVNEYGVRYKTSDGTHVFLYNGDRGTRPYKIAASRPEETTLHFLYRWIDENVPQWKKGDNVTQADLEALAQAVNSNDTAMTLPPEDDNEWVEYKYGLLTNGEEYKCKDCDWTRSVTDGKRGLHLHWPTAHDKARRKVERKKAGETRAVRAAQRKVLVREALIVLAQAQGLHVSEEKIDLKTIDKLKAQLEKVTKERDELKARMDLAKEAFKA